jgi:3-oxoacyl-[acyl-carrier-protein] synthase III
VLNGCAVKIGFPLEQMTGIASRRMAGEDEFSLDLARRAVADCLACSRCEPGEIDILICANISRYDTADKVSYEPNSSIVLKNQFGLVNAVTFDVTNACAGMFTAIYVVDALIRAGVIRCGMVVSGEYITHLTRTAQKEIKSYMDPQLACLTLGDAGAAVILKESPDGKAGFQAIDMYTLGKYSPLCIAGPTDKEHGGAVMSTDAIRATAAVFEHAPPHALQVMRRCQRSVEMFHHIIPHQTSSTSLNEGLSEIAKKSNRDLRSVTVNNLAERGNTASNTHFVALKDKILENSVRSEDNILFCISGSGMTIGTALYTLDDLPERLRRAGRQTAEVPHATAPMAANGRYFPCERGPKVRLEAVGLSDPMPRDERPETRELVRSAAENCLDHSSYQRRDIELLVSVGQYRTHFIAEPAIAALAAGDLKINENCRADDTFKTFAFDLLNGSLGFLNACFVATHMIQVDRIRNAMIVASEIENNADSGFAARRGLHEVGSAVVLDPSVDGRAGFRGFFFKDFPRHLDAFVSHTSQEEGKTHLVVGKTGNLESLYVDCILDTVEDLLRTTRLDATVLKAVFPPQISPQFVARLANSLPIASASVINIAREDEDLFTSSTPWAVDHALRHGMVHAGDVGLFIAVGTGIQVGCAIYDF